MKNLFIFLTATLIIVTQINATTPTTFFSCGDSFLGIADFTESFQKRITLTDPRTFCFSTFLTRINPKTFILFPKYDKPGCKSVAAIVIPDQRIFNTPEYGTQVSMTIDDIATDCITITEDEYFDAHFDH